MTRTEKFTIFYTDDDPEDLEFFADAVKSLGQPLELVALSGGEQLIELLHNPPPTPHILFLDINMPGLTGFDVLEHIRNVQRLNSLPIIVFTTSRDEMTIVRSRDLGANFFVPKSGHFPTLQKSIEYALKIDWSTFTPTPDNFVYAA